jgi:hypothetical protein
MEGLKVPSPKEELVDIFEKLSPENQNTLLIYARIAYTAEHSMRDAITRVLRHENSVNESV